MGVSHSMAIVLMCEQCSESRVIHSSGDIGSVERCAMRSGWIESEGVWFCPDHAPDIQPQANGTPLPRSGCEVQDRLWEVFGAAVEELLNLHEQQFLAIREGDTDSHRFDRLIHMANEKKHLAKYAYLRHVESHRCSDD
jgi:hypothetical protein